MKTIGVLLIVVGLACFASVFTGLVAWTAPMPAEPTISSISKIIEARLLLMYGVGGANIIGVTVALILGIKKSRQRKREGTKTGIRKPIAVTLVAVTILACVIFAVFKFMTRWDADEAWAAKIIEESTEIRLLLERFREENGEFPMSLSENDVDYTKPTDYLTRNSTAPETARWYYDRIGPDDYQLFATAHSWVSYFDAMVYRKSGAFNEPWFATRDRSSTKEIGEWRYIRGFSRYQEQYYFDADGNFHKHGP